jgi:hypothetical protein
MGNRRQFSLSHLFLMMAASGAVLALVQVKEFAQFFAVVLALATTAALWAVFFRRPR